MKLSINFQYEYECIVNYHIAGFYARASAELEKRARYGTSAGDIIPLLFALVRVNL